jgi:hypothetical protein
MKYAAEMSSGARIYIPGFIKITSVIQKFIGDTQTHRSHGVLVSLLLIFHKKEIGINILL